MVHKKFAMSQIFLIHLTNGKKLPQYTEKGTKLYTTGCKIISTAENIAGVLGVGNDTNSGKTVNIHGKI